MAREDKPFTSDMIAEMLATNPVVVRRTMSGLKKAGFVDAEKGPGGGWRLIKSLVDISLYDVYLAVGEPSVFAMGNERQQPDCLVELVVNQALDQVFSEAQKILMDSLKTTRLDQLSRDFQMEWNKCENK